MLGFSLAPYFHFSQDSQVSISNGEDEDVVLREVGQDESIMSHAHYSSFLHSSLASPLETSLEGSLYIDEMEELKRKRQLLSDTIIEISDGRISPIQSMSRPPWSELEERQRGYYVRKAREVIETTLQCLAPGSEADLWFSTVESMPFGQSKPNDATERLVQAYKLADNRHTRLQILSLFINIFSKIQTQEIIPGISKTQIDEARRHADLKGPGKTPSPPEIRRMRLEATKTDHFLDFILLLSLLQDVLYGTKSLKFDSGEKLLMPAAIRTVIPS